VLKFEFDCVNCGYECSVAMVNEKTRLSCEESTTKERGALEKRKSKKSSTSSPVLHLEIGETSYQGSRQSGIPFSEGNSVREVTGTREEPVFQTPCSISGISAGISSGMLGFVFGFGGYWLKERMKGTWKASMRDGWASAKTFAVLGGLYAAVSCFMVRLRQKNDAINSAVSGCSTGLVLGWKNGPASALQSCVLFGAFSYFLDGMSAEATTELDASESKARVTNSKADKRDRGCHSSSFCLIPAIPLCFIDSTQSSGYGKF